MKQKVFYVGGPPRSGTTFISDWITQAPEAYCAHEISARISNKKDEEVVQLLLGYAASGNDRYGKRKQREFLDWENIPVKKAPEQLGFKQPVVWQNPADCPAVADRFIDRMKGKRILIFRHPIDMIASAKHREKTTANWPGYSVKELCAFWKCAFEHTQNWAKDPDRLHVVQWERLLLDHDAEKALLERFLSLKLPQFAGYENSSEYFKILQRTTSFEQGVTGNKKRELLSPQEVKQINQLLEAYPSFGYKATAIA